MASSLIWGRAAITIDGDGAVQVIADGGVFQRDGEIVEVGPVAELRSRHAADEEIGSREHVVLPGLINAHHHVGLTPLQLGTLDDSLEPWITDRIGKRGADPYLDTLWGAITMIESGITTVIHNDTSIVGEDPLPRAQRVLQAYEDSGMRTAFSVFYREHNRLVYEDDEAFLGTLPPDVAAPIREDLAGSAMDTETYLSLFQSLHAQLSGGDRRVQILLAPGNVQWCSDDFLRRVKAAAAEARTGIHIHLLESPYQKRYGLETWGTTPVQHLHEIGFLGAELSCAHSVWLTDDDIGLLAASGTTVCHNPSSNLRLKSGIAPLNRMLAAGIPMALGIDEATINDDNDILQEMRLAAKLHREPGVAAAQPDSAQILAMATVGGARTVCSPQRFGRLEAGARADIIQVRLERIEEPFLDASISLLDAILYRGRATDVDTVLVDGRVLLRDGKLTTIDREAVAGEIRSSLASPASAEERGRRRAWEALVPYVRDYYARRPLETGEPHYLSNQRY